MTFSPWFDKAAISPAIHSRHSRLCRRLRRTKSLSPSAAIAAACPALVTLKGPRIRFKVSISPGWP
jgi:hypothetical protein